MKNNTLTLLSMCMLSLSALCHADYVPSQMPQGTPPQISEQTKQLIHAQIQTSPKLPANSASVAAVPTAAIPTNLSSKLHGAGDSSANNFDSQHAYHDKVKEYLRTHKR